jgi:hypothetical protein
METSIIAHIGDLSEHDLKQRLKPLCFGDGQDHLCEPVA